MSTKSKLPLTDIDNELPKDYRIQLFPERGDNTKMEEDIAAVLEYDVVEMTDYRINKVPFKYKPKIIINKDGTIKEEKKTVVWMDTSNKQTLESPGAPKAQIQRITETKQSILENIISFLHNREEDIVSEINPDITQSIIHEWVKQFMSARSICCYDRDTQVLFDDKTKLDLVREMFPKDNILLFDIITDQRLLQHKERITKGSFLRYDSHDFDLITENEDMERPLYVVVALNGKICSTLSVRDNATFKSYFPIDMDEKDLIDAKLKVFFSNEGFSYLKDKERKITKEQKNFLPSTDKELWREDLAIFGLIELLDGSLNYDKLIDHNISKYDYTHLYTRLANFAMKLK